MSIKPKAIYISSTVSRAFINVFRKDIKALLATVDRTASDEEVIKQSATALFGSLVDDERDVLAARLGLPSCISFSQIAEREKMTLEKLKTHIFTRFDDTEDRCLLF